MVFSSSSSIPPYLDPSNWHHHLHQQNQQLIGSVGTNNPLNQTPAAGSAPAPAAHGGGGTAGSIRPGSMVERARMANMPMPELALKCPRCESTNTKFCYFNNYSLSQPRHFCKMCRRYWTRGGALRNVPVGGGCRWNKKSKSTSTSSSKSAADRQVSTTTNGANSTTPVLTDAGTAGSLLGLTPPLPTMLPPLRFMSPLNHLTDNFASELGLNYSGITVPSIVGTNEVSFHPSGGFHGVGGGAAALFSGNMETWRLQQIQQFPFLTGNLDPSVPSSGIYQFNEFGGETSNNNNNNNENRPKVLSPMTQMASVKMEEKPELRQLGGGNEQWNTTATVTAAWTDLSSFSSSSTSNPNL